MKSSGVRFDLKEISPFYIIAPWHCFKENWLQFMASFFRNPVFTLLQVSVPLFWLCWYKHFHYVSTLSVACTNCSFSIFIAPSGTIPSLVLVLIRLFWIQSNENHLRGQGELFEDVLYKRNMPMKTREVVSHWEAFGIEKTILNSLF